MHVILPAGFIFFCDTSRRNNSLYFTSVMFYKVCSRHRTAQEGARTKTVGTEKSMMKPNPEPATKPEKSQRTIFQEYSEALVVAIILAILIRAIFFQAFKIPSGSMEPTLLIGDHILVCKLVYGIRIPFTKARWPIIHDPRRGDVIVFVYPQDRTKDFIKRVVGVAGDTVEIKNKKVFVNGKEVTDTHAHFRDPRVQPADQGPRDNLGPFEVPKDHLFVMGDNRDFSHDSRWWGFVPVEDVKGEAFVIYYASPLSNFRWGRLWIQ
jgi:signal peptidase I